MNLILTCRPDGEHDDPMLDYVAVAITPEFAQRILCRMALLDKLKQDDPQLYEMYYWDYSCDAFHYPDEDDFPELFNIVEGPTVDKMEGIYPGIAGPIPDALAERSECDQMVVQSDSIKWSLIPKHTGFYVSTEWIPKTLLREIAEGKAA